MVVDRMGVGGCSFNWRACYFANDFQSAAIERSRGTIAAEADPTTGRRRRKRRRRP
jgi:hypothetical protein